MTTAEPWSTWLLTPEIGQACRCHLRPSAALLGECRYPRRDALHRQASTTIVQATFPDKPIIIGEAGWPSEGRTRGRAEASLANEAYFVRAFVQFAMEKGYDYYLLEAYDQPWKNAGEGAVGAYWGLFDATGHPKFAFTGLLRTFPEWRGYALAGGGADACCWGC